MVPTNTQKYLAGQIIKGALAYIDVVTVRPQDKEGIDFELTRLGYEHLIVEV